MAATAKGENPAPVAVDSVAVSGEGKTLVAVAALVIKAYFYTYNISLAVFGVLLYFAGL